MNKFFYGLMATTALLSAGVTVSANNTTQPTNSVQPETELITTNLQDLGYEPRIGFNISTRKTNVRTRYEWSSYHRVSDTIRTGPKGGSISTTKSLSFGGSIKGSVQGIDVSVNGTVSSSVGYTLHIGGNQRAHIGYRVLYLVEEGTRIVSDGSGELSRNTYIARKPIRGEYALLK